MAPFARPAPNFRTLLLTALAGVAMSLGGCKLSAENETLIQAAFVPDPAPTAPPPIPATCFNDRFQQPDAEITRNIDILFMLDTSGSLDDERQTIANGIDAFVAALPPEVDYQIGVMLAHGEYTGLSGTLYRRSTEPVVLRSSRQSLDTIRADLMRKMTRIRTDYETDGGEVHQLSFNRPVASFLPIFRHVTVVEKPRCGEEFADTRVSRGALVVG